MNYCQNCINWRPKPGLKPEREGHCATFNRATDAIGGQFCSAFVDHPEWLENHGRTVANNVLQKHPDTI